MTFVKKTLFLTFIFIASSCSISVEFPSKTEQVTKATKAQTNEAQTKEEKKSYLIDFSLRKEKVQERYADINFNSEENINIAVMLPLSGKHQKLGKALFNSMQLALFDHEDPRIRLVPFDTKGNEYESIKQAEIIAKGDFVTVIGPVFAKNVKAIKPILKDTNTTIISFSNDPQIAGDNVYLIGMDIKEQVRNIAQYTSEQGFEYFAAILPSNDYGSTVITELRRAVHHNGHTVLKSEFSSKQTSLEQNIKNIAKILKEIPNDENGEPIFREYSDPSEVEVDEFGNALYRNIDEFKVALLIAESGNKLNDILELLAKHNIPEDRVQLIGLSNWYDSINLTNPLLQNAWFTDIPHENYDLFMEYYDNYYFKRAPRIAILAYDALSVVTSLAGLTEDSASFSTEMLTQEIGFNGISGIFRFQDTGISERLLAIYAVESSNARKIELENDLFPTEEMEVNTDLDDQNQGIYIQNN